jgi:tRNA (guanine26-N2/guanine27-N2)-dimethyltransferase
VSDTGPLVEVVEGKARLLLPEAERSERGPESKETAPVFYNPAMALNRDVSSLLFATRAKDGWHVLDGLAASGVRGIRFALEADARVSVQWNDWNPLAAKLLTENAARNGLEPKVSMRSLTQLLHELVWHCVEIDPFGSPATFLDGAGRAVRDKGLLGITATDATGLAGVYPEVCRRRYLAEPMHGELGHEVAQRVLAGAAVRHAAKHEAAMTPVLAHATDHYYRVMLDCRRGARRTDEAMARIGMLAACPACGWRAFDDARACPSCGGRTDVAGPLWTGPLVDRATAQAMVARLEAHPLARRAETTRLVETLAAEAEAPLLYYDLHKAGERVRTGSPPRERVIDALRGRGYHVSRVHFNRLGIRTDAPHDELHAVVREAAETAARGRA